MSMIGGISESLEGQPSNERMNLHVQQQSHVHHPQLDVLQNKTEDNRLIQQGQELCLAVQTSVDAAISGGGGVAFLDDEDDELPPPPPQNILSSALLATNPPICVPTPSSSSLTGSSTNSATLPATEEAFSCSGLDKNYNATSTQADEQVHQHDIDMSYVKRFLLIRLFFLRRFRRQIRPAFIPYHHRLLLHHHPNLQLVLQMSLIVNEAKLLEIKMATKRIHNTNLPVRPHRYEHS